ncbi:hypothetical protein HYC85_012048 [Camellia sinensis]|uniref:Uncharacterized protein n=1 Tax=Camellia sinensis TaxID=4442 RepID=A0A7J7HBQ2_CAMSI|nr:hypothetical protein HYC85_012048 [Camellia sinensis]
MYTDQTDKETNPKNKAANPLNKCHTRRRSEMRSKFNLMEEVTQTQSWGRAKLCPIRVLYSSRKSDLP